MDDAPETAVSYFYLNEAKIVLEERESTYTLQDEIALAKFLYQIHKGRDTKTELTEIADELSRALSSLEESTKDLSNNLFKLLIK